MTIFKIKLKNFIFTTALFLLFITPFAIVVYWIFNPDITRMQMILKFWWAFLWEFFLVAVMQTVKYTRITKHMKQGIATNKKLAKIAKQKSKRPYYSDDFDDIQNA